MSLDPATHRIGGFERCCLLRKNVLDRSIALALLLLAGVWLLFIAAAVRWDTPGPVLSRERRLGRDGRPFWLLSFRCSVLEVTSNGGHARVGAAGEGRVWVLTRTGLVLERCGLDRLPRLLNVLCGDMSLIGPQPQLPRQGEADGTPPDLLPVKPGLIGIPEVRRRHGGRRTEVVGLEGYMSQYSIGLDLSILRRALRVAVMGDDAW